MSLKAKIEAVIYASEEPVTLAQLTGLLGEEGQAELDHLAAQQQSLALEDESAIDFADIEPVEDADALNAEITDPPSDSVILSEARSAQPKDPEAANPATTAEPLSSEDASSTDASRDEPAPDAKTLASEAKARERKLRDYFRSLLEELIADYTNGDRGLEIREVAGGFRLATKPEYHDAVRGFVKSLKPPLKLTLQALETLAVVAYKQPVTAPEVSEIRGVDSAGVLGSLLTRKLVTTAGRKQVIGRPILYKTTKDFLLRFGLKDINELPSIEEFEKMAGELNDAVQEEIPMEESEHRPDETNDDETNDGTSPPVSEKDAVPEPTHIHHDTPEDLMSDKSTYLEGHNREHADPTEVEHMAETHSSQADGTPEGDDDSNDSND
jgi:segregation and condensation protein B